jgi:hypothetical protein
VQILDEHRDSHPILPSEGQVRTGYPVAAGPKVTWVGTSDSAVGLWSEERRKETA